jgi:hypothetical protein
MVGNNTEQIKNKEFENGKCETDTDCSESFVKWHGKIKRQLVSTLAALQRKGGLVNVQNVLLKKFNGPLQIKGKVKKYLNPASHVPT